jgi:hypothetical protein
LSKPRLSELSVVRRNQMDVKMNEPEKKVYSSPELKEWGSIADITLGFGAKAPDTYPATTYSSIAT